MRMILKKSNHEKGFHKELPHSNFSSSLSIPALGMTDTHGMQNYSTNRKEFIIVKTVIKKNQILISLIPILGSFFYSAYLFFTDINGLFSMKANKFKKSGLGILCGMLSFIILYGGFALICNATSFNLAEHNWLVVLLFYISGVVWNFAYFLITNKMLQVEERE